MQVSAPFLDAYLKRRAAKGKEDEARAGERRGRASLPRPATPLLWCHAASVGESLALLPVVERLLQDNPAARILVTTGTVTSAALMAARLPQGAFHQYMPVDHPSWVRSFLDHWHPDLVIWSESDFWPNMLSGIQDRGIPAVLINARMSQGSFTRWRRVKSAAARMLGVFSLCLAQNEAEAERLKTLGAQNVQVATNIKYAAKPLPCDGQALKSLREKTRERSLLLWASTHPSEEEIALQAHKTLAKNVEGLLTIIVPRHPTRGADVALLVEKQGLMVARRSQGILESAPQDVYIADTLGELGLFYTLCDTVVMGGSFVDVGGHNPIEPAQLNCAIFYGPQMYNFVTINEDFLKARAACQVKDVQELCGKLADAFLSPQAAKTMAAAALKLTAEKAHVLDEISLFLAPFVARAVKT